MMRTTVTRLDVEAWKTALAEQQAANAFQRQFLSTLDQQVTRAILAPLPVVDDLPPATKLDRSGVAQALPPSKVRAFKEVAADPADPRHLFTAEDWDWWRRWTTTEPW